MARRLARIALKFRLISPLHFGDILRRSSVDAVCTLTNDVERVWEQEDILTALAFDIKGAFDEVTKERLTERLWQAKIPLSLIRWVAFFLTDRKAAICLDGQTRSQENVQIGVSQGSPVAPILFILFTAPIFNLFSNEKKEAGISTRGYVDDSLLTTRHKSVQTSVSRIALAFKKVEQWAYDNGMVFDPVKFEAIYFSRKHNLLNLDIELSTPPFAQDPMITCIMKSTPKDSPMRWLGVYYDARFLFKRHVEKMASKGRRAVAGLKMLENTIQGVETKVIRRAIHECILSILTYASPAWWPGRTRVNKHRKTIWNGVEKQLTRFDKF